MSERPYRRWFVSSGARSAADLPCAMRDYLDDLPAVLSEEAERDLVVALATEALRADRCLPDWIGAATRYLIIADVPEPALLRLPTVLGLHKPDQRMHVTRDAEAVKRMVVALDRDRPWEGIVDAYVLGDRLITLLGDFRTLEFPRKLVPGLLCEDPELFREFALDGSGSYLHWKELDLHLGPSQLLQAVDPAYLAEVEIRRHRTSKVSPALRELREEAGLRQRDIHGLSERHVRRLEKDETRLTVEAAGSYAETLGVELPEFLRKLSRKISELREGDDGDVTSDADGARTPARTNPDA